MTTNHQVIKDDSSLSTLSPQNIYWLFCAMNIMVFWPIDYISKIIFSNEIERIP